MTTPNVVDLSKYQTKAINGSMDIDFADLKANGIKAVIIQLGHGVIQDPAAESFIAKANAVGLIVHGYHFFESGHADQVQFSITNAQQLGLSKNAYYFLDMEGNISGSWSDQFRPFYRNWKMNGWNVGLYASLSKYGLFNMDEFKTNHVYKWVANWDVTQAPGVADIWQYNCSTGLGSYTLKLDKDVDIAGNLIQPIDKPKPIATDPNGKFNVQAGAFVNFDYSTTEIQGGKMLVASPDGVNKIPKLYPDGTFGFINKDFDHIWEGIKDRFKSLTISNKVQWADILNRPDVATQADLKAIELKPGPQGPQGLPGKDGITPHVDSTTGDWFIGNQDTGTQAQGPAGKNGRNGVDGQPGKDGQNGITPHIDTATGNWFVGSTDTGIKAQGPQGIQGVPGKDGRNGINGKDGDRGPQGIPGEQGEPGLPGTNGKDGVDGKDGQPGRDGTDGKSAYQIWLDNGHSGTETDFLNSLKGAPGKDGVNGKDGAPGTPGKDGDRGPQGLPGTNGKDGSPGANGSPGKDGKSAYQIWLDNGHSGTETDFLNSLKGVPGKDGKDAIDTVKSITSGTLSSLSTGKYEIDFTASDSPVSDWGMLDVSVGQHYAKQVFTVTGATGDDQGNVYVRVRDYSGQWHEWREITAWN